MQDLTISLIQIDQVWEDKEANLALYESEFSKLPKTDLILLPEMFQTAFTMNTKLAEPFETSTSIAWLQKMAKEKEAAIYTSLIIEENEKLFNRGVFVEPSGKISVYNKRKSFGLAEEDLHFTAGEKREIVYYLGWKIQLQICYDLRFPEILRNGWNESNQSADYDVLLFVANWPAKRKTHWQSLLKARAIENQCYVVAVNRIGSDNMNLTYDGNSTIIDTLGNNLIEMDETKLSSTLPVSKNQLIETRKMLPFLKDQNPKIH